MRNYEAISPSSLRLLHRLSSYDRTQMIRTGVDHLEVVDSLSAPSCWSLCSHQAGMIAVYL